MRCSVALAMLLLSTGCASVMRHSTSESYPDSKSYPYCGVVYDGCIIAGGLTGESISDSGHSGPVDAVVSSMTLVILGIVDLPFSFCLDTVFLPYDIYKVATSGEEGIEQAESTVPVKAAPSASSTVR